MPSVLDSPAKLDADSSTGQPDILTIVSQIDTEVPHWRQSMAVTIGQAAELTKLTEAQIRYFEELEAVQPAKTSKKHGASRLYTVTDLRRLRALALLLPHCRPAEAAEQVRRQAALFERGALRPVTGILDSERNAVADGFFLVRLISQVIDAVQAELNLQFGMHDASFAPRDNRVPRPPHVIGALVTGRAPDAESMRSAEAVQRFGAQLCDAPYNTLVALCRVTEHPATGALPTNLHTATGRDDQLLLYYSRQPQQVPELASGWFMYYTPKDHPACAVLLVVRSTAPYEIGAWLDPGALEGERAIVLDRFLILIGALFGEFQKNATQHDYRYRSDGFPLDLTIAAYESLLGEIRKVVFPQDEQGSMVALLLPEGLDDPKALTVLTHSGYGDRLAERARVDLRGTGQGLSGRAYHTREPFISLHAQGDPRVYFGPEEQATVALAVPLAATWGISPFGVLYLASRTEGATLSSVATFFTLVLGNILSELLGRWWLTRLRKAQDASLHQDMTKMIRWIDTLDAQGPDLQEGLQTIVQIWEQIDCGALPQDQTPLSLVVLDIVHYRATFQIHTTDPFPMYAQAHVTDAIHRVLGPQFKHYHWFQNDHALLLLDRVDHDDASVVAGRIREQVALTPTDLFDAARRPIKLQVSAAHDTLHYQSLHDLGQGDVARLVIQVGRIIERLRHEAGRTELASPTVGLRRPSASLAPASRL